jgi:putative peptide zinc metalloprotease protein
MSDALHSAQWYRVAELRPRLRQHLRLVRQVYRGEPWYVLHDPASSRNWRFSPAAERVIRLFDGKRTVEQIWSLCGAIGDEMPTQGEVVQLLAQLHQADALGVDVSPDVRELLAREGQHRALSRLRRFGNPLAIRMRLVDPDAFLSRTVQYVRPLFGTWGALVWLVTVACGALLAAMHSSELGASVTDLVLSPDSLLVGLAVYVPIKALHELAHAYAVKVRGGEVHEIGVNWLVLAPVPYVDASSAAAFPDKRARMLVSAAGILAEVFIASLAMIVWAVVEPGVVRATAYYAMLIAGVSTVLFNGNPLLRYDGYYFLADLLEIPNLASRANAQLGYLLRRFVLGMRDVPSVAATSGEARWLVLYGVASFVYRHIVLLAIIAMLAAWSKPLALGLGLWWLAGLIVYPAARALSRLARESRARGSRGRALAGGVAAALVAVAALSAPLPLTTIAEGVMWLPENGEVRAGTDGLLGEWLVAPGSTVSAGQRLAELDDPTVEAALTVADSDVRSAEARYLAARAMDAVDAPSMLAQWQHAQAQYAAALERSESRAVTSPTDGVLIVANPENLPGRYFRQGDVIGYVVPPGGGTVLAVVPQDDIGLIRAGVDDVHVRLSDSPARAHRASIARVTPAGDFDLPSAALGTTGGGSVPVAPDDASGRRSLTRVFRVELAIDRPFERLGGRAFVRFDHGNEALVLRLYRRSRQLFLRHLDA